MALVQPVNTSLAGAVNLYGDLYTAFNAGNAALVQLPGSAPPGVVGIDAAGKLTPTTSRDMRVDTFGQASSDFLDWVSLGAVPDGTLIVLAPTSAAHKVVVRHAMTTADSDAGTILLADGVGSGDQLVLDALTKSVVLQRRGIGFYEAERHGFISGGSTIGTTGQNFGGYPVTGMRVAVIPISATSDTLARATDKGALKQYANAATMTLPNPNDQSDPDPTRWWQGGDVVLWEARAASLIFRRWDGAAPANAAGHDRALGAYAQGWVFASPNPATGSLEWILTGFTQGPPAGGTARVAYWSNLSQADLTIASTDTTTRTATSFSHAFGAGERWLYLARFGFYGAGGAGSSQAVVKAVMQGAPDVETAHVSRVGYATAKGTNTLIWGNTFGGSGGSQTVRIDAANAATGNQTVVAAPVLVALRLETDEAYVTDAGPHTDTAGTFTAAATLAYSGLPADEYEILFGCEWTVSSNQTADLQLVVNGVAESVITAVKASTRPAWFSGVSSATLSGSGSIIVQFRRDTTGTTGTITATNATVAILRKGRFQAVAATKSAAVSSTTTLTPLTSKVNFPATLQAGWYSLILGGCQSSSAAASGTALCSGQVTQGATLIGPAWAVDVNLAGQWAPSSQLTCGVVQPLSGTDTLDLSFASADGSTGVSVENACVVVLALRP